MRFSTTSAMLVLTFAATTAVSASAGAAAAQPCDPNAPGMNQMYLSECWGAQAKVADAALNAAYPKVKAGLHESGVDPAPLTDIQLAWIAARDRVCNYEVDAMEGGSIGPMLYAECLDRMTRARTARLQALLAIVKAKGGIPRAEPVSPKAEAEFKRVYGLLAQRIDPKGRAALAASQDAWVKYRDRACAFEGGNCATELARERTTEIESGWMGERFW